MLRRFAAWLPKIRSRAFALCAYFLQHILRLPVLLRKPLDATAKRHIQPKRYMTFAQFVLKI
jgi:hypothetical protein